MADRRRRLRASRAGLAVAGAAVLAASMTRVAGTLAAPAVERTATMPVSTANYYPTPLPPTIACETNLSGNTAALISWSSAGPGMRYRVLVWRGDPDNVVLRTYTNSTSYRYRGGGVQHSDRVTISTVNIASGATDATRVVSSGSVSHTAFVVSDVQTRCSGAPRYDTPNQPWENQREWTPAAGAPTRAAQLQMFVSLADELNDGVLAEELPTEETPGDLTDVPPPAHPLTTASEVPGHRSDASITPESSTSTDGPGATPGDITPTTPADPTEPLTSPGPGDTSPVPTESSPAARAELGRGPIAVGDVRARLEEVDGEVRVRITSADVEVCSAAVPGATAIEFTAGQLTAITGDGSVVVDPETCTVS